LAISLLRIWNPSDDLRAALGAALATSWPVTPNSCVIEPITIAWTAPGEWTLLCPADHVRARIDRACGDALWDLTDVSVGRRRWSLNGPAARDLLAQACTIDTHPLVFGPGQCAQSLFAQVPVLIIKGAGVDEFDLIADQSYRIYLDSWFHKAQGLLE
jgi:sarcosine oxidase subunit gamma